MAWRKSDRHRCLTVGCNPKLKNRATAENHREQTGHRIARWPVRSAEGHRKQRERNARQREEYRERAGFGWEGHVDFEAEAEREDDKGFGAWS